MNGLQGVGVSACSSERLSEEVVTFALTNRSGERGGEDGVDGQRQGNHTVATVDRLQRMGVSPRGGERLHEEVVATAFANLSSERGVEDGVDGQGQRNYAVAAVNGLQGVGVSACSSERLSEEVVTFALTNRSGERGGEDGVDGQRQGNHTVATVDRLQRMGVSARGGERLPEEVVAAVLANVCRDGDVIDGADGQMQCYHRVTAVRQCECLHVFAGGRVGDVVPSVAVACGDFDKLINVAGGLVAADIHRAVESRIAVKVKVADCRA